MSGPFRTLAPILLASASPRRQELLAQAGLAFRCQKPQCVEPPPQPGEPGQAYAARMAALKANAARLPDCALIAADTVVVIDGQILGKPANYDAAVEMLALLNGKTHTVFTAVCVLLPAGGKREFCGVSAVSFHSWPLAVLRAYAACGEPLDKAGAYAIQGKGAFLVAAITGSYSNVIGLPMTELVALLLENGVIAPAA